MSAERRCGVCGAAVYFACDTDHVGRQTSTGRWVHYAPTDHAVPAAPVEGIDRCGCGAKYWDGDRCASCGEQYRPVAS